MRATAEKSADSGIGKNRNAALRRRKSVNCHRASDAITEDSLRQCRNSDDQQKTARRDHFLWTRSTGNRDRAGSVIVQQMRGNCSPLSMSTTRVPPIGPRQETRPGGPALTEPTTAAPAETG